MVFPYFFFVRLYFSSANVFGVLYVVVSFFGASGSRNKPKIQFSVHVRAEFDFAMQRLLQLEYVSNITNTQFQWVHGTA